MTRWCLYAHIGTGTLTKTARIYHRLFAVDAPMPALPMKSWVFNFIENPYRRWLRLSAGVTAELTAMLYEDDRQRIANAQNGLPSGIT